LKIFSSDQLHACAFAVLKKKVRSIVLDFPMSLSVWQLICPPPSFPHLPLHAPSLFLLTIFFLASKASFLASNPHFQFFPQFFQRFQLFIFCNFLSSF
jgi:hypothetical protein